MRVLLSNKSRQRLFQFLKEKTNSHSNKELAKSLKINAKTLNNWINKKDRYLPGHIIPEEISHNLSIIEKRPDNWGKVKGGKKTYKIILKKYGAKEIRRRQSKGGKNAIAKLRKIKSEEPFNLDLKNPHFLEFYGILLGDGWIGRYSYKNKTIYCIGISGHIKLDEEFFHYCKKNIESLFNRNAYLKKRKKLNSIELQFSHQKLHFAMQEELGFPLGKKVNLKINKGVLRLGFDKTRHVIRGIFDTDGSFYLDKTPAGLPYPCISIEMKAPILIGQVNDILKKEGFKVYYREKAFSGRSRVTLKGTKQIKRWMETIGSSNPKHLDKIARVVQPG